MRSVAREKYRPDLEPHAATAEERLHAFVRSFLLHIFGEGQPAWHGKLWSHEMIEPTRALDELVETEIRPNAEQLESIVRALLGDRATREQVRLCATSIVRQCLFYHHARAVIVRLYPEQRFGARDIARLSDHIKQFSLGALKQIVLAQRGEAQ